MTTAFGVLEVSGTTFGVLVNDDGMTATIYEGHGIVGGLSGGNEIELAAAQTATVGSDGRISEVTSARLASLDSTRILMIDGEVDVAIETEPTRREKQIVALVPGDCLRNLGGNTVTSLEVVPCSNSHAGVVSKIFNLAGGPDTPFPTAAALRQQSEECPDDRVSFLAPKKETWDAGRRRAVCVSAPMQ